MHAETSARLDCEIDALVGDESGDDEEIIRMLHLLADLRFTIYNLRLMEPKIINGWIDDGTFASPIELDSALYFFGRNDDTVGASGRFAVPETEIMKCPLEIGAFEWSEKSFACLLEHIVRAIPEIAGRGVYEGQVFGLTVRVEMTRSKSEKSQASTTLGKKGR
ncbi:MAG: hypothetical protein Greene041662_936 [Candidatus Peregrinibacteria bacterium Greene0416_62]|nr:MAG: hypothetical protein Greene041662_936 [Candidatus Peregrinibacteria bacterium Greene0416_62]